ncbi:MAG: hypothetical protein OQK79_01090 [Rhodanobacter sp.]|jgi:hypothetical protein|nr:hypothetical protein [Rhodanobacter sp.]
MHNPAKRLILTISMVLLVAACRQAPSPPTNQSSERDALVGAWTSQIHFSSGALAEVEDLEFMYVYNAGGTMTESSNYDGAPPVPPAYGGWKRVGHNQFETRYAFYATKAPGAFADIAKGGGWLPAGHGLLTESIKLSDDGKSYTSTITYAAFDRTGKPIDGGGQGTGVGARMGF